MGESTWKLPSLKLTVLAPKNDVFFNRHLLFQGCIFRCKPLVSGRTLRSPHVAAWQPGLVEGDLQTQRAGWWPLLTRWDSQEWDAQNWSFRETELNGWFYFCKVKSPKSFGKKTKHSWFLLVKYEWFRYQAFVVLGPFQPGKLKFEMFFFIKKSSIRSFTLSKKLSNSAMVFSHQFFKVFWGQTLGKKFVRNFRTPFALF